VNYATLVFSANEWPVSHDQTDAYFTRWIAVPFTQRYREDGEELKPGEKRADPKLADRLLTEAELQGLLVRAVHGARRLRERGGFDIPKSVRDSVTEYRQWADTVMAWVDDAVSAGPDARTVRSDVYRGYRDWCKDNGRAAVSTKRFWPRFREVLCEGGIELDEVKSDGVWHAVGIQVAVT
jgi:putative DNA primase/helicase